MSGIVFEESYIIVAGLKLKTAGLKILTAHFNVGGSFGKCTFREYKATSGYTPSGSKSFRLCAVRCSAAAASAVTLINFLGQTDNDLQYQTNNVMTNAVGFFAGANDATSASYPNTMLMGGALESAANPRVMEFAFGPNTSENKAVVANGKYLSVGGNSSASGACFAVAFGYEV